MTYSKMSALRKLFKSELFNIKFEYTKHTIRIQKTAVWDSVRLKLTGFKIPLLRNQRAFSAVLCAKTRKTRSGCITVASIIMPVVQFSYLFLLDKRWSYFKLVYKDKGVCNMFYRRRIVVNIGKYRKISISVFITLLMGQPISTFASCVITLCSNSKLMQQITQLLLDIDCNTSYFRVLCCYGSTWHCSRCFTPSETFFHLPGTLQNERC